MTLYLFTPDKPNKSTCAGGCAKFWPPVLVAKGMAVPTTMTGMSGKFGVAVRADGSRPGFSRALSRMLCYLISLSIAGSGFIIIAFNDKHQGLHDNMADTFVVPDRPGALVPAGLPGYPQGAAPAHSAPTIPAPTPVAYAPVQAAPSHAGPTTPAAAQPYAAGPAPAVGGEGGQARPRVDRHGRRRRLDGRVRLTHQRHRRHGHRHRHGRHLHGCQPR